MMRAMAKGSIRQRSATSWELRVYVGVDLDGRSRYKVETVRGTRAEADRRLRRLLDEVDEGGHRGPNKTVGELLDAWLTAKGPTLSPSTLATARGHIRNYLGPRLGRVRLAKLEPAQIDMLYGELRRGGVKGKPLADSYIRRLHGTLHLALEQAVAWGWITKNPASRATPPAPRRGGITPPDADQVQALLDEAIKTNPPLAAYLRVAAVVGARRGELAGLRRSDIDFESGQVTFRRVIIHAGREIIVKPYPKTKVARRVSVGPGALAVVADHLDWLAKRAADCGTDLDRDPWVFSHDLRADLPPRPDAFTRSFIRLRDRMGLAVRLHDLRHHHATELLTAGVDVRTVAGRLGHANASTTLSVYAGWVPAADRAAAELADARIGQRNLPNRGLSDDQE